MIDISELRVVEDTFFKTDLKYYKPSLYMLLVKHFKEEQEFSDASLVKLKNLVRGQEDIALNKILQEDVDALMKEIEETPKQFDEELWRDMLPKIREEIKKKLGLEFKPRSIFFDETFPQGLWNFEKKGASSVTIFEGNKDAGIYFLNKRVSSLFTPILLIHEQLHSCLSQNKDKDQMYIEWFEEGLCQWYSMQIYYDLTKNFDVLEAYRERAYIYSKVKGENNFTKRYYEYMKIFARLYLNGKDKLIGKLLMNYLSNEREEVNKCLRENLDMKKLPEGKLENFMVNFASRVEPMRVNPLEYLIMEETLEPKTIQQLSSLLKAPGELLKKIILALQIKGLVIIKNEKIEINWRKKDLLEKKMIMPVWPLK